MPLTSPRRLVLATIITVLTYAFVTVGPLSGTSSGDEVIAAEARSSLTALILPTPAPRPPLTRLGPNQSAYVHLGTQPMAFNQYAQMCVARIRQAAYHWPHCVDGDSVGRETISWAHNNRCGFARLLSAGTIDLDEAMQRLMVETVALFAGGREVTDLALHLAHMLEFSSADQRAIERLRDKWPDSPLKAVPSTPFLAQTRAFRRNDVVGSLLVQLHPDTAANPRFRIATLLDPNPVESGSLTSQLRGGGALPAGFLERATRHMVVAAPGFQLIASTFVSGDADGDTLLSTNSEAKESLIKARVLVPLERLVVSTLLDGDRPADLLIVMMPSVDCGAMHALAADAPLVELARQCNRIEAAIDVVNRAVEAHFAPFLTRRHLGDDTDLLPEMGDPAPPGTAFDAFDSARRRAIRDRLIFVSPMKCNDGHIKVDALTPHCTEDGVRSGEKFADLQLSLILNLWKGWDDCVHPKA